MKKVFLTLVLAAFAFAANAQFVVSGNLGFGVKSGKLTYDGTRYYTASAVPQLDKQSTFGFNLAGGYQINDKIRAGITLGWGFDKVKSENGTPIDPTTVASTDVDKNNHFAVGVYGRYNCWTLNKWTVFAELNLGIATRTGYIENTTGGTTVTVDDPKIFAFQAAIVPGFAYQVSEHVAFDLYLDFISLAFYNEKTTTNVSGKEVVLSTSEFGLKIQNNSMSIADWNSAVRMGVSFTF